MESTDQQNATSHEDRKKVLENFMEDALRIEDVKDIEFQRVIGWESQRWTEVAVGPS